MTVTLNVVIFVQIPDKARVTHPSSDPKAKFYELMKVRVCGGFEELAGDVVIIIGESHTTYNVRVIFHPKIKVKIKKLYFCEEKNNKNESLI